MRVLHRSSVLLLVTLAGCGFGANPTETVRSGGGEYGTVVLALTSVPPDVQCLRVTVMGSQTVVRTFPVTAGGPATVAVTGLQPGPATIFEEAFNVPCAMVDGSTPPTWVAPAPVPFTLAPSADVSVTVTLKRPSGLNVRTDFEETGVATVSPALWDFGSVPVGASSNPKSFTISNATSQPVPIGPALGSATVGFTITTNNCTSPLNPGASCNVTVSFTARTLGSAFDTLMPIPGKPGASLIGGGLLSGKVQVSPSSLDFGDLPVGQMSAPRTIELRNETDATAFPAPIIQGSADFVLGNVGQCLSLVIGQTCTVVVTYAPTSVGAKTATLVTGLGAAGTAALSGFGLAAGTGVSPNMFNFGTVPMGTQSPSRTFTLTNVTRSTTTLTPLFVGGEIAGFKLTANGCANVSLPPGGTCNVDVAFLPTSHRSFQVNLTTDPARFGSLLTGVGGNSGKVFATPATVDFGSAVVGTPGATRAIEFHNDTDADVVHSGIILQGANFLDFSIGLHSCPGTLPAGGVCVVNIDFKPTAAGMRTAVLMMNAGGMTASAALAGTGAAPGNITLTPATLSLGPATRGGQTAAQTFTVQNGTAAAVTLTPTVSAPDFVITNLCPATLAAGASCTLELRFAPTMAAFPGPRQATLMLGGGATATGTVKGTVWDTLDIGTTSAGSTQLTNGQFTIKGGGADVFTPPDAFHFAFQSVTGDATIVAKVASLDNTNDFAKAMVMMRAGTGTGDPYAAALITPKLGNLYRFQTRLSAGGGSTSATGGSGNFPVWLRVVRTGNSFTASFSSDGKLWNAIGTSIAITMPPTISVGLGVTSHNTAMQAAGVFSNVSVTQP